MVAPLEGIRVVEVASFVAGHAAGSSLVCGILAALRVRDRTGRGQVVDVSLFQIGLYVLGNDVALGLVARQTPKRRWSPVREVSEVLDDPQARAMEYFRSVDHPRVGRFETIPPPRCASRNTRCGRNGPLPIWEPTASRCCARPVFPSRRLRPRWVAARRNRWRVAEARSPFWTCPPYLRIITRGETPGDSGRTK